MPIKTREDLINALVKAAELEHGLMIQYLYAEMTLKDQSDDLTPPQVTLIDNWRKWIAAIARQEMGHLAMVLNLLEAIGGGAHLDRLRLPSDEGLYTPPIRFSLDPLTLETVERFIDFETPVAPGLVPARIDVTRVGQLYTDIKTAITTHPNPADLFVGRLANQDRSAWSFDITVMPVTDPATAALAIDAIIVEGEGNASGHEHSHFGRFVAIREQYKQERIADPGFTPHRAVVSNPGTLDPPSPATIALTNVDTRDVAALFNACYTTLLLVLVKYYRFDETQENQEAVQSVARGLMILVLARLGPLLSRLPAAAAGGPPMAGPPFEIYTLPALPHDREASLKVLRERLAIEQAFAAALAARVPTGGVVARAANQLTALASALPS